MLLKRLLTLTVLFILFSCDEESPRTQKEEWILTEYRAKTTSSCFALDDNGNITDSEPPHPILNTLLGLDDPDIHEIMLSLDKPHTFLIFKDGYPVMNGRTENDHQHLRLKYDQHLLEMKIQNTTGDSLTLEAKGYTYGITDVTMTFYRKKIKLEIQSIQSF
jgi:hypothetical protein